MGKPSRVVGFDHSKRGSNQQTMEVVLPKNMEGVPGGTQKIAGFAGQMMQYINDDTPQASVFKNKGYPRQFKK